MQQNNKRTRVDGNRYRKGLAPFYEALEVLFPPRPNIQNIAEEEEIQNQSNEEDLSISQTPSPNPPISSAPSTLQSPVPTKRSRFEVQLVQYKGEPAKSSKETNKDNITVLDPNDLIVMPSKILSSNSFNNYFSA